MNGPSSEVELSSQKKEVWPDGPLAPPQPLILKGPKAIVFYFANLLFLALAVAPILLIDPLALQGLDCFLSMNPSLSPLRIPLGLAVTLVMFACMGSVVLLLSIWMYRKWSDRVGQEEFAAYLFHDPLQKLGTTGRKLNAFLLRQARK